MTPDEALAHIHAVLEQTLEKAIPVTPETDLFGEKILDSLGFNKVARIIDFLVAG